ncbi:DUF7553 family protein [Halosimplex salinum]|uniref:DUF7553 family protein n=1 Tax=Halosimplex salinum TaxID=1710538 RepID=UPI001F3F484C|nr:hypothetical protein [Halosimplex salinum]
MPSHLRDLLGDWQFWHALTVGALTVWLLAKTNRFWLMTALQRLAWNAHGSVPFVPQAGLDQIRPVVNGFVAVWLPIAIGSFVCGFFAFHAEAEAESQRAARGQDPPSGPEAATANVFDGYREPSTMTRENLADARDTLESAAEATADDDAAERLTSLADQLGTLATRDRDPDHGRLARIENALHDLEESTEDVADRIESAHESVVAFRETVEGV